MKAGTTVNCSSRGATEAGCVAAFELVGWDA
jgi:hypothetical protein